MKRKVAISLITIFAVLATMMTVAAFPETGVPNSNRGADCGFQPGCHQPDNSLTMAMQASSTSLTANQTVSVWVNVTRNGAGGEGGNEETSPLAVILLSGTTTGNGTDPLSAGWSIVSDPDGTGFNENQRNAGTGPTPYHWVLKAPSTAGSYKLVAQAFHDGPSFTTYSLGIAFTVSASTTPSNGGSTTQSSTPISPGIFAIVATVVIMLAIIVSWLSVRRKK
ncbi:MAG TPA: hypothetical protein VGK23_08260 [Methanomassiliicoccales archaeon]|jgi:hypothetical protein